MAGFTWPGDHRAALALTFDVDAESAILAVDPAYAGRLSTMGHQAYGPKVGVPRILRMLERTGVRGSFFVPGLTVDRYPGTVEAILAAGHEIGHHGYSHVPYHRLSEDGQRRDVERAFESLEPRRRSPARGLPGAVVGALQLDARAPGRGRLQLGLEHDGRRPPLPDGHGPGHPGRAARCTGCSTTGSSTPSCPSRTSAR